MRIPVMTLAVAALFIATCAAQSGTAVGSNTQTVNEQNANNVCRIFFQTPKPGMAQQFEAARKKHNTWRPSRSRLLLIGRNTPTRIIAAILFVIQQAESSSPILPIKKYLEKIVTPWMYFRKHLQTVSQS